MSELALWIALFTILIFATLIILALLRFILKVLLQLQRRLSPNVHLDASVPLTSFGHPNHSRSLGTTQANDTSPPSSPPDEPPNSPLDLSAAIPRIDTVNGDVNPTFVAGNFNNITYNVHLDASVPLTSFGHPTGITQANDSSPPSSPPDEPIITSPNSPVILPVALPRNLSVANHASGLNRLDLDEHVDRSRIDMVIGNVNATFVAGNQIRRITHNHYHRASTLSPNFPQTALFPEMPDSLRDILHAHLFLREIMGTTMVFRGIPSVLQIARVHERRWKDVAEALELISPYFDGMNEPVRYFSNIQLSANLRYWLSNRAQSENLYIDPPKYHAKVARWCLVGNMTNDPRNISYAADNWAHHLCKSDPSSELCRALQDSSIVFRPASHNKLLEVIHWLESSSDPQEELMTLLQSRHKEMDLRLRGGIRIEVMGGAASMILSPFDLAV
ncbi:hypothetical protein C8J57DRAFT_1707505 [Mycena rebaudengoi]|nr:hypothetical protein C8J57DRAFT_1707505 [Mycena rebaudengoi]